MKTNYKILEVAPDNWAIAYGDRIEMEGLTVEQARKILEVIEAEVAEYQHSITEAENEARDAEEREAMARSESEKLLIKLDAVADKDRLVAIAARVEELRNNLRKLDSALANLKNRRGPSGILTPPWLRREIDAIRQGEFDKTWAIVRKRAEW